MKRDLLTFLLLCVLAFVPRATAAWRIDYALNGSFELDANRDAMPDGWRPATFDSPAQTEWDRTTAYSGQASVRIADSKHPTDDGWRANSGRWVQASRRDVRAGATYSLRGRVKTHLTRGAATLALAWFSETAWLHEDTTEPVSGPSDWVERVLTASPPEGATSVAVYLMLNGGRGSAWFDDITMTEGEGRPENLRPLGIRPACNTGFVDEETGDGKGGWTDQGPNDARMLPRGLQTWRSIPFEITDPAENDGRSCIVLRGRGREGMPMAAEFAVGRRCDVVYFLHGCAWGGAEGAPVGRYLVTYADGGTTAVPLRNGHEIVDWWAPRDTNESAVSWEGSNPQGRNVGLSVFPWTNPRPDVPIARIKMESAGREPVPILVAVTTGDGPPILTERMLPMETTDVNEWYEWAFALDNPALEEIDLSFLLDPPAGKHGFLSVGEDGHFYFEDGTRARFFGTNVGGPDCAPDKREAEVIAERLARYGVNMLRLHTPDSRWGTLINYERGDTRHLNEEALDRYDYFVAQLKNRGIYVYFDLLDYRDFQPGDGVRDADQMETRWSNSIKGASIFDRRMIELQKEFATQLLTHRNPYTGNRYVDEPALAVQEITNENSLFYLANTDLMLPSYMDDLRALWNRWLLDRYGGRQELAEAWTDQEGECALLPDEDPARGNVRFPVGHLYNDLRGVPCSDERSPARMNAITRFLYELEAAYYDEMVQHLRGLGLRCPITGTNQDFSDASNLANARCDFTSRNNYWCHPNFNVDPFRFENSAVVNSDIASRGNPIAEVSSSAVAGKPMIVPEFNFPWPNEWRAECLPLMAAYGRLQDWDGLLYFAYDPDGEALSSFGNQSDPVRWGQVPLAALLFLRGDISVARNTVHVGVSSVDAFAARPRRTQDRYSPYRVIPYISRMRNVYFDTRYEGKADVAISSGHSASGDYGAAQHAIVFADSPFVDEAARHADRGRSVRQTCPGLETRAADGPYDTEILPQSVPQGSRVLTRRGRPVGVVTETLYLFPCASADEGTGDAGLHRLYLEAAHRWDLTGAAPVEEAGEVFRSDTGELVLRRDPGVFTASAPRVRIATGFLGKAGTVALDGVNVKCRTPFASVSLISLDGKTIEQSERLLLTAVARSENTGQAYATGHSSLPETGRPPVRAEPVDADVRVPGARPLEAWSLSPTGRRLRPLEVVRTKNGMTVRALDAHSPWILLVQEGS